MIFDWFKEHHRKTLREQPFPEEWKRALDEHMAHYALLTEEEQRKLQDDIKVFVAEKSWEGCGGLELTEEMKATIAGLACLLILNRDHTYFSNVESILVYPSDYVAAQPNNVGGRVVEELSHRLGEAWSVGPVVLSWYDVQKGGANIEDGHNVVLHEFAHKLDLTDGSADGVPLLDDDAQVDRWAEVMSAEYQKLVHDAEKGHATLLDRYGATNAAEFFAVATECFFEKSQQMRERHPDLYEVLSRYYHQDPAARMHPTPEVHLPLHSHPHLHHKHA